MPTADTVTVIVAAIIDDKLPLVRPCLTLKVSFSVLRFIKCITLCRHINRLNRCRFIMVPIFAMSFGKFGLNDTMLSKKLYRPIGFNHTGWDVWMADHIIAILLATTARSLLYRNSAFYQSYPLGRYPVFPLQPNSA